MLTKRIIPCLDIKDGRTVKGVNFINLVDAGDPVELAKAYVQQGADELVFLDITATLEKRRTLLELVKRVAAEINIPFTVGGGVHTLEDAIALLHAGADKLSLNTAAVENPSIITQLAKQFGSQCIVIAIDTKQVNGKWKVFTHGGHTPTDKDVLSWANEAEKLGAGEILLTSMNHDGTKKGFALELTRSISETCHIPVIASGGAGKKEHFLDVFKEGQADAALAASIFHFGEVPITGLKRYLRNEGIPIRLIDKTATMNEEYDLDINQVDFEKGFGLVPAIVQHFQTGTILMLGYMNKESLQVTQRTKKVTFFSRSKKRLWTKGESSSHYLLLKKIYLDCDKDTLLIMAEPQGPTCHTGMNSCFGDTTYKHSLSFLTELSKTIHERKLSPQASSYTCNLFQKGLNKICKKVGEEASETIIAALNQSLEDFKGEAADLIYHLLVLLEEKGLTLEDITRTLKERH